MVSAEAIESTLKRNFNNMQGYAWHRRLQKAVVNQKTDCKWIADLRCEWPGAGMNCRSRAAKARSGSTFKAHNQPRCKQCIKRTRLDLLRRFPDKNFPEVGVDCPNFPVIVVLFSAALLRTTNVECLCHYHRLWPKIRGSDCREYGKQPIVASAAGVPVYR
jgi:hypothetical protein